MKLADRFRRNMNDGFKAALESYMLHTHKVSVTTKWNIFADKLVTTRNYPEGAKLSKDHVKYISAFEAGYLSAMENMERKP